jgi:hypothetical protein
VLSFLVFVSVSKSSLLNLKAVGSKKLLYISALRFEKPYVTSWTPFMLLALSLTLEYEYM